jgi:4-hydroxybenzoyl-CoA thioesterase
MIFAKRFRYRFGDIDHAGIAYYPKLLHYFHCCFEDWWSEALGHSYAELLRVDKLGLPAVRLEVDFMAPVRYGDEPTVHLGVLRIGRASVEFGFWMTGADSEPALCRARITTVAVHMDTMQKRPLPDLWRQRFGEYLLSASDFPPAGQRGSSRNSRGK